MLFIIEGPDGSGKSTLAHRLLSWCSDYGSTEYKHFGPPQDDPLVEYVSALQWYKPDAGHHLVIDRLHWGELVYGPVFRGESLLGQAGLLAINELVRRKKGLMIHTTAPRETLMARIGARGETTTYEDPTKMTEVLRRYSEVLELSKNHVPVMIANTYEYSADRIAGSAIEGMRRITNQK